MMIRSLPKCLFKMGIFLPFYRRKETKKKVTSRLLHAISLQLRRYIPFFGAGQFSCAQLFVLTVSTSFDLSFSKTAEILEV